ncbi:HAMP domain-containing protein [Deinococcus sp. Marseille-Q6407]|uniref:HAMP domain-containing protein n=1 Tax=Deinococcus sp. Marseille-Q6407 TaxID=2969223 RepID=UPI0021C09AE3|nr:HAMP domain-containing protein [Deinococcus sp. Marseille-Q6407]
MKYTVVIQQPVQDEVRADLEQRLQQGLGLSASAAGKLSARRSGRLLKPTTRPKAEKLLGIFSGVGADVTLEEVPEEGTLSGLGAASAAAAPAPGPAASSDSASTLVAPSADPFGAGQPGAEAPADNPFSASPLGAATAPAADPFGADPFGADPFGADPFSAAPSFGTDPFAADPFAAPASGQAGQSQGSQSQVFSAAPGGVTGSTESPRPAGRHDPAPAAPADDEWASFTQDLGSAGRDQKTEQAGDTGDVWADFADSLKVDVPVPERSETAAAPAPLVPSFMDVADDAELPVTVSGPRRSLERQLLLSSLLPTAALALLSLLLLSTLLPAAQRTQSAAQAQTLARSLSATLQTGSTDALQNQLRTLANDNGIGFVQVQVPGGSTYFASDAKPADSQNLQKAFAGWKPQNNAALFRNGNSSYAVGAVDATEQTPQVSVGVPYRFNLARTVLPWLLASLALLGLAALWARRAAQGLLQPLQRLVRAADAISAGDLNQPVHAEANDEVGDLAQALERMRLSLSAAMDRLRRRKR